MTDIDQLPLDIKLHILMQLDVETLDKISQVNLSWNQLFKNEYLWKQLASRDFDQLVEDVENFDDPWFQKYRILHEIHHPNYKKHGKLYITINRLAQFLISHPFYSDIVNTKKDIIETMLSYIEDCRMTVIAHHKFRHVMNRAQLRQIEHGKFKQITTGELIACFGRSWIESIEMNTLFIYALIKLLNVEGANIPVPQINNVNTIKIDNLIK